MLEKVSNMKYATILYQQWNNFATFSIVTDVNFFFLQLSDRKVNY